MGTSEPGPVPPSGDDGTTSTGASGDGPTGPGDDGSGGDGGGDGGGDDGDTGDDGNTGSDDDFRYDVGADPDDPPEECDGETGDNCGCTSVDLLFVIDNSTSMGNYQNALGLAFPQFADTLIEALPESTNLHVGVTSTEMGFCGSGSTSSCSATCNGEPAANSYITPDMEDTGRQGAQGRLFPSDGMPFYEIDTDAPAAEIDGLKTWFAGAAAIGEGGSNIEMSAATAGWAMDPANDATNAGFVRDVGSVLVVFFLQDEPDQTPSDATQDLIDKIATIKSGCGGLDCVIGGGFVGTYCLDQVPLGDMLDSFGAEPVVAELPSSFTAEDNPQQAADEMNELLSNVLADVIGQKCEDLPPPK